MVVNTLISAETALSSTDSVFVDCRFSLADPKAGREAYKESHIPNAHYLDLEDDLSGPVIKGETGRHPLPDTEALAEKLGQLGITNQTRVIAYDADSGAFAARLWWLLRYLGHDQVWVLNGGFKAWQNAGGEVTATLPQSYPASFKVNSPLCRVITADDLTQTESAITDARDLPRYLGEQEPIDPVAGHIPGARCLPFANNLTESGQFKSQQVLREQFLQAGISDSQPSICYCGSGVTACHNIIALCHAGFPQPVLYPGSWSEWITNSKRPIATGPEQ